MFDHLKDVYDYPLHKHAELELTFMENCTGVRRVVGDSMEVCGQFDLALIGSNVEHAWEQQPGQTLIDVAKGHHVREYVVQFSPDLLGEQFLSKSQMVSLKQLLENAKRGIAFDLPVIMRIYSKLDQLSHEDVGFPRVLKLMEILYQLSTESDYHLLASPSFSAVKTAPDSRRIHKVEDYINEHFKEEIRLTTLADLVGMTSTAFSRFFRIRTGRTLSDYIIDIRLGFAARQLVDTSMTIVEVCYQAGFNNVSNFNRIFRKRKGCSPSDFRNAYHRNRIIV